MMMRITSILLICLFWMGCQEKPAAISPGTWRAVLAVPGGELPFSLEVSPDLPLPKVHLINGEERVAIDQVRIERNHLFLEMPAFNSIVEVSLSRHSMKGFLTLIKSGGKPQVIPFQARHNEKHRFFADTPVADVDLSGRWAVSFLSDGGDSSQAVGEFLQQGSDIRGTFLTPTGDYRFLAGEVSGRTMYLSCFDGAHAFLFRATLSADEQLVGEFWSGTAWHESWSARRDAEASLEDAFTLTFLKDGYEGIDFQLPNTDSVIVSLADERFRDKVVILTIAGSWCPNCHDEARFMAPFYKAYREQGLEVVGLMFEHFRDFPAASRQVERFRRKLGIDYELLVAGFSDKVDASRALPMLNQILSYPTTIFIDRRGVVRRIHTGFSGPGTGEHYRVLTDEFRVLAEQLLAE